MRVAFIASEYNPFHNGHKYHIDKTKETGVDAVICIMSGNFVQRGDIAVAEKHLRAEAALLSGADLVIELPLKYATSTASYFAKGFIETAKATGLEGIISFGAGAEISKLKTVKNIIFSEECKIFTENKIREGISFPAAKTQFIAEKYHDIELKILNDPNNILAFEYMNAVDTLFPSAEIFTVKRTGAEHDSLIPSQGFASASYIRNIMANSGSIEDIKNFIPDPVFKLYKDAFDFNAMPTDRNKFNLIAMSRITDMNCESIKEINNVNGGIENRIFNAVKNANSIDKVYENIKSKHYTHSRIRQIILHMALGIKKSDLDSGISYIRVLGFNNKGREVLNKIKSTASVPVITNLSQLQLNNNICRDAHFDYLAARFLNFCLPQMYYTNPEYQIPPVYRSE